MANSQDLSRRELLGAAAVAVTTLLAVAPANAGAIPQASVKYMAVSDKEGKKCSGCKLFIPGATPEAAGQCKSVAGEISPNGYCALYAAKEA